MYIMLTPDCAKTAAVQITVRSASLSLQVRIGWSFNVPEHGA